MANVLLISGVFAILFTVYMFIFRQKAERLPLPPGPPGLPVIGNIFDLPKANIPEYQHWLTHQQAYGPLSSTKILNTPLIILHGRDAVHHILETNSLKTSGRPQVEFGHVLCEFNKYLFSQEFDDSFRRRRKLFHRQMGTKAAVAKFDHAGELEAGKLLTRMLQTPDVVPQHFRTQVVSLVLRTTYGYAVKNKAQDLLVDLVQKVNEIGIKAIVPMVWAVDIFPFIKYFPSFLPGMQFKELARQARHLNHTATNAPFLFVKDQMNKDSSRSSFVSRAIEDASTFDGVAVQDADDIKLCAAAMYIAGGDTVTSALTTFLLAMTLYPNVQRRAQEEIDRVIGSDRLPRFQDRDRLPYVNALVKEVLRWRPVLPLGLPHLADGDVEYGGYLIPKGSIIIPSLWWLCHDPEVYSDPGTFCPERYLERNEPDPVAVYGFGRRICPGRHLADATLFITMARALAAFSMERGGVDDGGKHHGINPEITSGIVGFPTEVPHRVAPRSDRHGELIRQIERELPLEEGDVSKIRHLL